MAADVTAREFPGRIFHGRIDRTAEAINPASGTLQVEALVPNADGTLVPGMYVEVAFITSKAHPPAVIPAAALLLLSSGPHVAVIGADDIVHIRPITIGRDLGDNIEVADGLAGGETIALNLSYQITDGQKVAPVAISSKDAVAERSDHRPAAAEP
jgi:RND family efflux transporter MFP subunit